MIHLSVFSLPNQCFSENWNGAYKIIAVREVRL